MTDSRNAIRNELASLVREGGHVHLVGYFHSSPDVGQEIKKQLSSSKSGRSGSKKAKATTAGGTREQSEELLRTLEEESFGSVYQSWYSRALLVVKQLLPDRFDEFCEFHRLDKRAKALDVVTYTIADFIQGLTVTSGWSKEPVFDTAKVALTKVQSQIDILQSAQQRLDSLLSDITGVIEADLLDDELSTSRELLKAKYLRAGGIVAGVVLERHLKRLIDSHHVTFRKTPQIGTLNDALKGDGVYDVPVWRQIQRLGDIRNLCGHDAGREPTANEVDELISGAEKITTTVF